MDLGKILHGFFGSEKNAKRKHARWENSGKKSELSKRVKAGHKGSSGAKRNE
ncbi:MAG TPA: hypothetical protein VJG83_01095 [archaeon]|nr:hypothetical protein [archaeon]